MTRFYLTVFLVIFPLMSTGTTITQNLCHQEGYHCIVAGAGDTWDSFWPQKVQKLAVQRVNRMNIPLLPGTTIAVPNDLKDINALSFSPLPLRISRQARRTVWIYLTLQAWGAYDYDGRLLSWGAVSSGSKFCSDIGENCQSDTGDYNVRLLFGPNCISARHPKGECGGEGQGSCIYYSTSVVRESRPIHGTDHALLAAHDLPGFPSTTGCFHLLPEDFDWLYHNFMYIPWNSTDIGTSIKIRN